MSEEQEVAKARGTLLASLIQDLRSIPANTPGLRESADEILIKLWSIVEIKLHSTLKEVRDTLEEDFLPKIDASCDPNEELKRKFESHIAILELIITRLTN